MVDNPVNNINSSAQSGKPALWGGIECSITRVGGKFQDQLHLSGHYNRDTDIEAITNLGFSALRFPILFEKHQSVKGAPIDWSWTENRLEKIRQKNIVPIAGLVHHGSGPAFTNLLSKHFATHLASFASQVAAKFPWIEYYTPVNEPLTTARFSGLYGLWYPHHTKDKSFCKMLINELKGVVLAMQEIRKVNPQAKLVQTEDLGKIYATPNLQYQADFENERRWLTFDLLCGRVDQDHTMWQFLADNGVPKKELEFFLNNPCPPHILGLNHYATSERFLDDNINAYPEHQHGGNHIERYVDTEAARINHQQPSGLRTLLQEVHDRYALPMAMTEIHLQCTREEQLRWFHDVWSTCCQLNEEGLAIKAVTAWSLIGAYGWNKLLTSPDCDYEPGVFDLRSTLPRPTAIAKLISTVARGDEFYHPLLEQPGWWKRNDRFHRHSAPDHHENQSLETDGNAASILIYGDGIVAEALTRICNLRAIPFFRRGRNDFDLSCEEDVTAAIAFYKPWAIVSADIADGNQLHSAESIYNINRIFARHCNKHNLPLLYFSHASVFAAGYEEHGEDEAPDANTNTGRIYQTTEQIIQQEYHRSLMVRTGKLFCSHDDQNFACRMIGSLLDGKVIRVDESALQSFSYLPDVVNNAMDLLIDGESGTCHLVNPYNMSEFDFALEICKQINISPNMVVPEESHQVPHTVILNASRFTVMPSLQCSLAHFVRHFATPPYHNMLIFNNEQV